MAAEILKGAALNTHGSADVATQSHFTAEKVFLLYQ
jgi:hypothetical protein